MIKLTRDMRLAPLRGGTKPFAVKLCVVGQGPRASGGFLLHPGTSGWAQKFYSKTEGPSNGPTLVQLAHDHLRVHCNHRNRIRSRADRAIGSTSTNTAFSALSQSHRPVRPNGPWHAGLFFSRAPTPSCATSKPTSTDRNFEPEAPITPRSLTGPATETQFLERGSKGLARPPSRQWKMPSRVAAIQRLMDERPAVAPR